MVILDRDNTLNYDLNSYTHKISDLKRITLIDPILKSYQEEGYHLCVITINLESVDNILH